MSFRTMTMARAARMVVETSAGVKQGEQVCVVTDTNKIPIAEAIANSCAAIGAETVICIMAPRRMHGNEPPSIVAGAMKAAQVVIAPTTWALTHTDARKAASAAGTRIVVLRGITEDTFTSGAITADYMEVNDLSIRVAQRLTEGSHIHVVAPAGTDLRMSVAGRSAIHLGGIAHERGQFTSLPSGEGAIVPTEGSAEGVLVADHAIDGVGLLSGPVRISIKHGRAVKIEGGRDAEQLRRLVEGAEDGDNVAEFAIGTNPNSRMLGNLAEDKILRGCVHVALGDSHTIGGDVSSEIHLDHVVLKPTVWIDGEVVVEDGQIKL